MNRNAIIFAFVVAVLLTMVVFSVSNGSKMENSDPAQIAGINTRASAGNEKDMTLFFHNDTTSHLIFNYSTTYIFDTLLGVREQSVGNIHTVELNFYLFPQLAGNLTVRGNITVGIYANTTGVSANGNLNAEIYDVINKNGSSSNEVLVGTGGPESYTFTSGIDYYSVTISNVNYTFAKGHSIRVYVEIQGGASSYFTMWYGNPTYDSRVVLPCSNYTHVQSITTYDALGNKRVVFDPTASDKNITILVNVTDPFGGYDIRTVDLTLLGPTSNVIVNNVSINKVAGTPISFVTTFKYTWDYSGYEPGTYEINIWSTDNNGYNYYWHFEKYSYGPYQYTGTNSFDIGYKNTVLVSVYDSLSNPLSAVSVEFVDIVGNITTNTTNANGIVSLNLYNGTYTIKVMWDGNNLIWAETKMIVDGNNTTGNTVTVLGNTNITIFADIGFLKLHVVDSRDIGINGAICVLTYPNGTEATGIKTSANGDVNIGYTPGGEYGIKIYWKNVIVYDSQNSVHFAVGDGHRTLTLGARVFYTTIEVVNNTNAGIGNLEVVIYNNQTLLVEEFSITNISGVTTVRLPVGLKNIVVYSGDQVIAEKNGVSVNGNSRILLHAWIYNIVLHVIDSKGVGVGNASIYVYRNGNIVITGTADANGNWKSALIKGNYTVKIYWMNSRIYSGNLNVSSNMSKNITTSVYYLNIVLKDNNGNAVNGYISITGNGTTLYSGYTKSVNIRLPAGQYTVHSKISKVMYLTGISAEKTQTIDLSKDTTESITFNKYPISFVVSNLFYMILGYIAIILAFLGYIIYRQKNKKNTGNGIEEMNTDKQETEKENNDTEEKIDDLLRE